MIYDCTQTLTDNMSGYPGDPVTFRITTSQENNIRISSFHIGAHVGTHIETSGHFYPDGRNISSFSETNLLATSLWLTCEPSKRGFALAPSIDIFSLPDADWIFFRTGWSQKWGISEYYRNFPGLEPSLVEDLCDSRFYGIGIDAPSIDAVNSEQNVYPNHLTWLSKDLFIIENLWVPKEVEDGKIYKTVIAPLPVMEAEASPVRVFQCD